MNIFYAHMTYPGFKVSAPQFDIQQSLIYLSLSSRAKTAPCPRCSKRSRRVHSRYTRSVADLPWAEWRVQLSLQARRFRCEFAGCSQRIFCERFPSLLAPWARKSLRLAKRQREVGMSLGGAAGARLCSKLRVGASRNSLLRLIRSSPREVAPAPSIVAVDDWAMRKGQRYGTIIVDLERRRPVGLLPEREAATIAAWFKAHPEVQVVARDRATQVADGVTAGAPRALQVADRYHLLDNVATALQQVFERHRRHLTKDTAKQQTDTLPPVFDRAIPATQSSSEAKAIALAPGLPTAQSRERRAKRLARYQKIHELRARGWTISAVARHLKIDRRTVRRALNADVFPELKRSAKKLDPYKTHLVKRWNEGCRTSTVLIKEIEALGYTGARTPVVLYLQRLRQAQGLPPRSRNFGPEDPVHDVAVRTFTPHQLKYLVLRRPEKMKRDDKAVIERLCNADEKLSEAIKLAQDFAVMLRERQVERVDAWLELALTGRVGPFRRLAKSFKSDYAAFRAAFSEPWSTGPAEGHINRLKMIKRQMFGRAKLDLLEKRFLFAG